MSPGPGWIARLHAPWLLSTAGCLVLASFAFGFSRPPLMPQAFFHLGLLVVVFGSVAGAIRHDAGTLVLKPGQPVHQFDSASGPRRLPFDLVLQPQPIVTAVPLPARKSPSAPEVRRPMGLRPFPGQLLVQWPARSLSVRLPVHIGDTPLLVPPGESPTPSNAFRMVFLRLVPDFVMDPTTHEVTARSDKPANPALLVREIGPGYTLERWLFARFPELAMHQEAEQAAKTSPLRLRYEADALEEPTPPDSLASTPLSGTTAEGSGEAETDPATAALAAWALKGGSAADFNHASVIIVRKGQPCWTNRLESHRPLVVDGYIFEALAETLHRSGPPSLKVTHPGGAGWVVAGAGLTLAAASLVTRRSVRPPGESGLP
ncbi:MAG: hypothetical protein JNK85_05810 [Verrucomicrobiales bacterium]|nr:hypothetical protein [Verrucomicrobiales bacterium]